MLLHLHCSPEIHLRLLFGTNYPLSVSHLAAWGQVGLGTLGRMIRTKIYLTGKSRSVKGFSSASSYWVISSLSLESLRPRRHGMNEIL